MQPKLMAPKLSILICHVPERAETLARLMARFDRQRGALPVEILIHDDPREERGGKPTGMKRNELVARAAGEYVVHFDDDDEPAENYCQSILQAIEPAGGEAPPDVVGFGGIITIGGEQRLYPQRFVTSIECDGWYDEGEFPNKVYYRCPNHINPVRRELAIACGGFPNETLREDYVYSMALRPLLKTQKYIEGPLYFYLAR